MLIEFIVLCCYDFHVTSLNKQTALIKLTARDSDSQPTKTYYQIFVVCQMFF